MRPSFIVRHLPFVCPAWKETAMSASAATSSERLRIHVQGIVQGVGFRPFVYGLALRLGLDGFVLNSSAGVTIEVEGMHESLEAFTRMLVEAAPTLARIEP